MSLKLRDQEIYQAIEKETLRQQNNIELIASENFVSKEVLEVQGSILTNKYAEGYPNKRYYGGCVNVDVIETLAIERAKKLFDAKFANVQPHSGSTANMAAYRALINPKDKVLGMALDQGGHLTHGHPLSFSGMDYQFFAYHVCKETGLIDYDEVERLAQEIKPALIVAGASAYSRIIDFKRFRDICDLVNAKLMVDMAHIAGLVAAKLHPNPIYYADIVTTTTHKTLRGPRGGLILTNHEEVAKTINKVVFPGIQGGPLMHIIAAKAVCFLEDANDEFVNYQKQVLVNAKVLSDELQKLGYAIVAGGTDNHQMTVDVKKSLGITGKMAEEILDSISITCNKNTVPFDTEKPMITSGIRLGSPSVTTRGFKEAQMQMVARLIDQALRHREEPQTLEQVKQQVWQLTDQYPIYK